MGKASISINIDGRWNGSGAVGAAVSDLGKLNATVSGSASRMAAYINRQEALATRLSRLAASTSKSSAKTLADAGQSIVETSGKLWNLGDGLQSVGDKLTKGVTVPLVAVAKGASETAVTYDTALANVRKVTNMTEGELQRLGQSAIEMSKVQPVSADTILNVEALGAQFGIAEGSLESFATTVTGLDIATDMNAEQAETELAQFKNIVQMSDEDMGRYASTIVDLGNNFATTESQISSMSLRFASAGKQAGLSSSEILALSAAMSSMGIKAEMGGSALSQVFVKISKQVAKGGDGLEAYARTAGTSAGRFREAWQTNASDAFVTLLQGISDATEAGKDMNTTMSDLGINEIRQSDVMRRLAGNTDLVRDALSHANTAWQENTALQNEVNQRNESMASRLQVLANKVKALAIQVGVPLVNAVIAAADAMGPALEAVSDVAQGFADMDEQSQRTVLALAGVAAAAGPVSSGIGGVLKVTADVTGALGGFVQDAGTYADAMGTVDGAQLRVYESAGTMAGNLGIAKNKVVDAAGGVDRYVDAWGQWYSSAKEVENKQKAIDKLNGSISSSTGKASDAVKNKVAALSADIAAAKASRDANADLLVGWKRSAGMSEEMARSTTTLAGASKAAADTTSTLGGKVKALGGFVGSSLVEMGKSALVMGAWGIAVAGVVAVVGELVGEWQKEQAEQKLVNDATRTFADVAAEAASSAQSQADGIDGVTSSADACLQSLADLNEAAGKQMRDVFDTNATLDTYVDTINRLSGQSQLSVTDQERLAQAVKGYNDITGDSVEITNAARGELSKSTEDINKNADAWKRNVEMQAYRELAIQYAREQVKAQGELQKSEADLTEKTNAYNKAHKDLQNMMADGSDVYMEQVQKEKDAKKAMDDATDSVNKNRDAYDSATKSFDETTAAAAALGDAVRPLKDALTDMGDGAKGVAESVGMTIDQLAVKLQEGGVSAETLASVGSESFASLASACHNNVDAMIDVLANYNGTPFVDKEGKVQVDQATLVDANGNIVKWNNGKLETKEGYAISYYTTVQDGSGAIAYWNGQQLVSKEAYAQLEGSAADGTGEQHVDDTKAAVDSLQDKTATAELVGGATDGTNASAIGTTKGAEDSLYDKASTVELVGGATNGANETALWNTKGAEDSLYDKTVNTEVTGGGTSGANATALWGTKRAEDSLYDQIVTAEVTGGGTSGANASALGDTKRAEDRVYDKSVSVNVNGNYGSATGIINSLGSAIDGLRSKTVEVVQNFTKNIFENHHAAGGIRLHADGGIRYHAGGAIATRAVPLDIVGEDGAEAIVPLTNRRYSLPFARTIAQQMRAEGATGNVTNNYYTLNVDGRSLAANPGAQRLLSQLVDSLGATAGAGVSY